ncbi:MAG: SPOR domain-containing protein [Melioribacteraceae bacterium]|nr:SPOR domain-containing protein [Melioribacteraceae bacterium]
MTKEELKKRFCGILNISPSVGEKAFSEILKKISTKLDENNALEIDQLGIFVLREEPLTREERSRSKSDFSITKKMIYFLPKRKAEVEETESFYLTFDPLKSDKAGNSYSDEVFSLSINAPLIPVNKTDDIQSTAFDETENLDNKIDSMINTSNIIQDFDFWSEVTAYAAESNGEPILEEEESELRELVSQSQPEVREEVIEDQVVDEASILGVENKEYENQTRDQEEIHDHPKADIPLFANDVIETEIVEDDISDETTSEITEDWNWGDELKKEFQDEEIIENTEINSLIEETTSEADEKKSEYEDPFEEVEKSINEIDEQTELDESVRGTTLVEDSESEKENDEKTVVEKHLGRKIEDYEPDIENHSRLSFGPIFWIILSVIIFLGFFLIYFFYSEDENKKADEVQRYSSTKPKMELGGEIAPRDTMMGAEYYQDGIDSLEQFGEIYIPQEQNGNTKVETKSTTQTTSGGLQLGELYRQIPNENQLSNLIFFDGSKYNVQVASHKSKDGAETVANKLRNLGYDSFIVETYLPALKGTWYRVRVGFFDSKEEAEKFRKDNNSIIN